MSQIFVSSTLLEFKFKTGHFMQKINQKWCSTTEVKLVHTPI